MPFPSAIENLNSYNIPDCQYKGSWQLDLDAVKLRK
jgi:hypothetical protein